MTKPRVLQTKFTEAINQCYIAVEESGIEFKQFKVSVVDRFCPQNICMEQRHIGELFAADEEFDDTFRTLTQHGLWDYQNYLLLKNIISWYLSKNTRLCEVIRTYEAEITCYRQEASIFDAHELHGTELAVDMSSPPDEFFEKWNVRLESTVDKGNLQCIAELSVSLAKRIGLAPEALLLRKLTQNPLTVMWFVPTLFCTEIFSQMLEDQEWLKTKKITYMALGEYVLYDGKVNINVTYIWIHFTNLLSGYICMCIQLACIKET